MINTAPAENARQTSEGFRAWLDKPLCALLLLLLLSAILLRANFDKPFYNFDDEDHFRYATERPISALLFNFNSYYTYMPVSALSLRLDRELFGPPELKALNRIETETGVIDNGLRSLEELDYFGKKNWAPPIRVENGLYHALAAFVLWLFLRRLKCGAGMALFVAAAWAVHPMACESVCWISERKNVLAALFGFAALWAQTRRDKWWRWPLASLCYLLSITSKPTGLGFFPIMAALEFLPPAGAAFKLDLSRSKLLSAAGLIGPLLLTYGITKLGLHSHKQFFVAYPGGSIYTALLTDFEIFARYVFNILLPVDLSFFYGLEPIRSALDARVWQFGALLLALGALCIWLAGKNFRALALFGLIWFLGALGPTSNIAPIPYWMQDRYAYFAAPGLLLAVALGVRGALDRLNRGSRAVAFGGAFIALLAVLAFLRSPLFESSEKLVQHAAQSQARSGMAHFTQGRYGFASITNNTDPAYRNSARKRTDTMRVLEEFEAAMRCPDINNFCDIYELRVTCAELLAGAGMNAEARKFLEGWLPPAHLEMLDDSKPYNNSSQGTYYKPQTLAYAWLVMAAARFEQAAQRRFEGAAYAEVSALGRDAVSEINRSIAVHVWAYQGFILKARMLGFLSKLEAANHNAAEAAKLLNEARNVLEHVPANSDFSHVAAEMLAGMK